MEAASAPLLNRLLTVLGRLVLDLLALEEHGQNVLVDRVVFNDQHVDGWYNDVGRLGQL
jgi:hypothetical protein